MLIPKWFKVLCVILTVIFVLMSYGEVRLEYMP